MSVSAADSAVRDAVIARQHLIDPEICIRCNTCEETCPVKAVTHDSRNYVVDFALCNGCMACIPPCPTGSIDNWRHVAKGKPYAVAEQLGWDALPEKTAFDDEPAEVSAEVPADVRELTDAAASGSATAVAPRSAAHPSVNLYSITSPIVATVSGNLRLTADGSSSDVRHIVLDFGATPLPVLEGQSIGVIAPGLDENGRPHHVRLYSVASPRDGERPGYNNIALTVKRVTEDHDGRAFQGVCSNYLCDLKKGDKVQVVGPYGATFLMPNHAGASLLMICTGTGSAPMRAMTERRRRRMALKEGGKLMLFFGARSPQELPYFGPLMKLPQSFIDINLAFSRVPDQPKHYVQDLIRIEHDKVAALLRDDSTYVYLCGLKGMEVGVLAAFDTVCNQHALDWSSLHPRLLAEGRLHIETY